MEEGEEIGLVLARASELRSKIACMIPKNGNPDPLLSITSSKQEVEGEEEVEEEEEVVEEEERLVGICDALESLERQLAALQDLQHQQRYERETVLNQIDRSRRVLLDKLKDYKGQDWEVIQEASAFAGETIENDDGLILPPYSNHVTNSFVLDDLYPSNYAPCSKLVQNGFASEGMLAGKRNMNGLEKNNGTTLPNRSSSGGIRSFIGWMTKSVITVVGVVSILSIAGYKPVLRKSGIKFETLRFLGKTSSDETPQCPPGKFLVVEDGRAHCVVKERVEIPFESAVTAPNAAYGFG